MAPFSLCQPEVPKNRVLDVEEMPVCDRRARASSTPPGLRPTAYRAGKAPCCQRPERLHRRRVACILVTGIVGTILVFDLTADRLISAFRQSQSELLMILLLVLTYLAGFAKASHLPPCAGAAGHSRGEAPGTGARKAAGEPTKHGAAKIASPTKGQGQLEQLSADRRLIEGIRQSSLPADTSTLSTLVGACTRLHDAGMALDLFDHMLKTGIGFDQQSVSSHISSKFFKIVAGNMDDKRMQKDGVQLVRALQAHGLEPSTQIQNLLICSWKSKLPEHVVEVFVNLREKGVHLSTTAYRCVMAAHERSEPAFTLQLYDEMVERGIKIDRVAFNAVLCACSCLGMTKQALGLFEQMPGLGLVPNGKTYGTLIRACTDGKNVKQALKLFESMRAAGIEPNNFAFRDAIQCCVKLKKFDKAYELYKDMVAANTVPCGRMREYIMEACKKNGCPSVADRIQADMAPTGLDNASWVEDFKASAHGIDSETE